MSENPVTNENRAEEHFRQRMGYFVIALGMLAYGIGLLIAAIRQWDLFNGSFRVTGLEWMGQLGAAALVINAVVLPLFLHYRASGNQFVATVVFYALDLFVILVNANIDARANLQLGTLQGFFEWYYVNILFATPVLVMAGWAVLFILDPASKLQRAKIEGHGHLVAILPTK